VSGAGRSTAILRPLLVILVLLAAVAGGFLAHRLTVTGRGRALYAEAAHTGVPPAATDEPAASGRAPIPEQLPRIVLPSVDGKLRQLADWRGKELIVNFWATWCEPCRREIPLLRQLRREHAGLEVVGIAIDHRDAVQQYAADHGIDYPLLVGEEGGFAAASALGMETVLPFSVFADRSGKIITVKVGELHRDEAELILGRMKDEEAGRLSPAAARAQIADGVSRLARSRASSGD
jgi:thiol-disulfide isomerase/thioredoxin